MYGESLNIGRERYVIAVIFILMSALGQLQTPCVVD